MCIRDSFSRHPTHKALRHGSHSLTCKLHHVCLSFVSVHQYLWYSVQCKTSRTTISTNTKIPSQIPQRSCFAACWRPECPANHTLHCSVLYCVNTFGECLVQMFQFHPFNIAIPGGTKSILGPILSSTYGTSSSTY